MKPGWRFMSGLCLCGLATALGGCAAAPLAALATVADISSDVVGTGSEVFKNGKLESVELTTFSQCEDAIRQTFTDFRLNVVYDTRDGADRKFEVIDDTGATTDIVITRRSPVLCYIKIDVGYFGSEPLARLLLRRIRVHLPMDHQGATTLPALPGEAPNDEPA